MLIFRLARKDTHAVMLFGESLYSESGWYDHPNAHSRCIVAQNKQGDEVQRGDAHCRHMWRLHFPPRAVDEERIIA